MLAFSKSRLIFLEVRIIGKVTDERKQPLPGVTVIVKGLTLGTSTDPIVLQLLLKPHELNPDRYILPLAFPSR